VRRKRSSPAIATISQTAKASQKKTNEIVCIDRTPTSAAIASVATEYMPSGNTSDHQAPVNATRQAAA
jgi:hypothetical protein